MTGRWARTALAFTATYVIMVVTPFPFYGLASALGLVEIPEPESPAGFILGVLVMKIGIALAFVLLYRLAAPALAGRWGNYAAIWWVMYAIVETGQAVGPGYSAVEAVAGVLAEAVYFPLSGVITARLLGTGGNGS